MAVVALPHQGLDRVARAADADPTQTEWRYQLAIAAEKNGDRETTQAAIERCLLQQPDNKMFQEKARKLNDSRRK